MGFIKGKAFPIVNTMAKKGNIKAKQLLLDAPKLEQEKVDNIVSELLGSKRDDNVAPIKEDTPIKEDKMTKGGKEEVNTKGMEKQPKAKSIKAILEDMRQDELATIEKYTKNLSLLPETYHKNLEEIINDEKDHANIFEKLANATKE